MDSDEPKPTSVLWFWIGSKLCVRLVDWTIEELIKLDNNKDDEVGWSAWLNVCIDLLLLSWFAFLLLLLLLLLCNKFDLDEKGFDMFGDEEVRLGWDGGLTEGIRIPNAKRVSSSQNKQVTNLKKFSNIKVQKLIIQFKI